MTVGMISSVADLTPAWFTELLRSTGDLSPDATVTSAVAEPFGGEESMMSSLVRVSLDFDGASAAPDSLIVKTSSQNDDMRFVAGMFKFYEREIRFYNEVLDEVPIKTPRCLHAEMYPDDKGFILVLEEVTGCRQVDQVTGMGFDDAVTTLEALADLHAPFWGKDLSNLSDTMLPFGSDILQQIIPAKVDGDWQKIRSGIADDMPSEVTDILDRIPELFPTVMQDLMGENTLVHADCRADNMLFRDDNSVIVLDFQLMAVANGMFDPAYLISQSLDDATQDRAAELIDVYLARLGANGIQVDVEEAMVAYRASVLFNIGIPMGMLAAEGLHDRAVELGRLMVQRASREAIRSGAHLKYA